MTLLPAPKWFTLTVVSAPLARDVWLVLVDGHQSLDVTGPSEVFAGANAVLDTAGSRAPRYRLSVIGPRIGPVPGESGLELVAERSWTSWPAEPDSADEEMAVDDLVVAGGNGVQQAMHDADLVSWVASMAVRAERVVSICSGSFLLAEAGLLQDRRATTHWSRFDQFDARYPRTTLDRDALFVRDGKLITSAGVTAGIDLALALVEDDHGTQVAQTVARHLVMFLRRPGGQSQFAAPTWSDSSELAPIRDVCAAIHADPSADLSVAALARRAAMSERNFARVFRRELGESPGRYVERARVDAARRSLEAHGSGVEAIARTCGFGSAETMRRAFLRQLGVPPSHYRKRFSHANDVRSALVR